MSWSRLGTVRRWGLEAAAMEGAEGGYSVSPGVKLMLLQGQLAAAPPAPASPEVPTRASELAAVLASLNSESEDCRALLRRAAASRQFGGGVEEEMGLAEDALDLCREGYVPASSSTNWEAAALCAVAEAHLGVEDQRQVRGFPRPPALDAAREALALCRHLAHSAGEAEALVTLFKAQLCTEAPARELLLLWRELGASWAEVACQLQLASRRLQDLGAERLRAASAAAADEARQSEQRWALAEQLCCSVLVQRPRGLEELLSACRAAGALTEETEAMRQAAAAEAQWQARRCGEARRLAARALRACREEGTACLRGEVVALLVIARSALLLDREDEAWRAALEALRGSRACGHRRGEAFALHLLAESCAGPEEALQLCAEAGRLFCDLEERRAVASLLSTMSKAHLALNSHEEALAAARDSVETFREQGGDGDRSVEDTVDEAAALLSLGKAQVALQQHAMGQKSIDAAVGLLRGLLEEDIDKGLQDHLRKLEGEAMLSAIEMQISCSQPEEALKLAMDALERFRSCGQRQLEAKTLQLQAKAFVDRKEHAPGRAAAKEALVLFQELRDCEGEKEALQLVVSAELLGSSSGSAMQTAKQAVERFQSEGDRKNEALALQTVARTHIANREFLRGARVAKDAQQILAQLGDTDGEIQMLQTAVEAHLARPEEEAKEDALQTAMEALAEFRRRENLRG
ncbi:unnamed protein product, partial [Effrenium voratum]